MIVICLLSQGLILILPLIHQTITLSGLVLPQGIHRIFKRIIIPVLNIVVNVWVSEAIVIVRIAPKVSTILRIIFCYPLIVVVLYELVFLYQILLSTICLWRYKIGFNLIFNFWDYDCYNLSLGVWEWKSLPWYVV